MMKSVLYLSLQSMRHRLLSTLLTLASIAISVSLLLGVERIRAGAREGFEQTLADTDLIVGARGGSVQLLLYSVFHIGSGSHNLSWQAYQEIAQHPEVAWSVPLSLGDSHRGFHVVGTSKDFFKFYKVGRKVKLAFTQGRPFDDLFEAVVGAEVARKLNYKLGQKIVLAHGVGDVSFQEHDDKPFTIAGILARTGTPADRTVHISLAGLEAMHVDWEDGGPPLDGHGQTPDQVRTLKLEPKELSAFLLGLRSKIGIFHLQREINSYEGEPLTAILPGATLRELWETITVADGALLIIACFVVVAGLLGMVAAILTTLNERRRELAILRSLGARPGQIFLLLMSEAAFLAMAGGLAGVGLMYAGLAIAQPLIEHKFGLAIPLAMLSQFDLCLLGGVIGAAILAGSLPAIKAYRSSLADGLTIRL